MTVYEKVAQIVSPVYQVGGSVRDELLKREPKDFDFSTPLTPEEIEASIKGAGRKCYNIGKRFGTLGVKIDGELVEITTFRNEKYKVGNRKPEVNFVKDSNIIIRDSLNFINHLCKIKANGVPKILLAMLIIYM